MYHAAALYIKHGGFMHIRIAQQVDCSLGCWNSKQTRDMDGMLINRDKGARAQHTPLCWKITKKGEENPKKSRNQDTCSDSDTYCVPASPATPTTPKDDTPKKIAGLLQQVDVGKYVEHQID